MGSSLQRIEVLLIALALLIAGAVVAGLALLRPVAPAYQQATPQPIVISVATQAASAPTSAATPMSAPTSAPVTTAVPQPPAALWAHPASSSLRAPNLLITVWPWLLLGAGLCGGAIVLLRRRKRRMSYTGQSVGQLLATADAVTRETNVRIMRGLAEQGVLTPELAAAAGIDIKGSRKLRLSHLSRLRLTRPVLPRPGLPRAQLPRLRMPALHISILQLLRRRLRWRIRSAGAAAEEKPARMQIVPRAPDPAGAPGLAAPEAARNPAERELAPHATQASRANARSAVEPSAIPDASAEGAADAWTAEDRALAVADVLAGIWVAKEMRSALLALDATTAPGCGQVGVTIEGHPTEDELLADLPRLIAAQRPTWRATWRRGLLAVEVVTNGVRPPAGGPLVVPILAHGRGRQTTRFYPLGSWRHLGLYGGGAPGVLHAVLASLLYNQPPANLALAIIDNGEIAPLYRNAAHLVRLPGSVCETIERLVEAIRRGTQRDMRPLALVVVEPDDGLLELLAELAARMRARPSTPLHLLIVQARLSDAGRELYAMLPALLTGGGRGPAALLPGRSDWPKPGAARLVGRGMRIEGRAISLDESDIAELVSHLRGDSASLPPVLWDALGPANETSATTRAGAEIGDRAEAEQSSVEDQPIMAETNEPPGHVVPIADADRQAPVAGPQPTIDLERDDDADGAASIGGAEDNQAEASVSTTAVEHASQGSRRAALLRAAGEAGRAAAASGMALPPHRRAQSDGDYPAAAERAPERPLADRPPEPQPMTEPANGWPPGPAPLGRTAMAELMARVVASPMIIAGQANELGVTKNRLVDLLKSAHTAQARELAEWLLVWLDQAGLLADPTKPGRLRHPRALVTTNLAEIAERLNATPCPDRAAVKARWALSNEGRD